MTNDEALSCSSFLRHSSFVLRHFHCHHLNELAAYRIYRAEWPLIQSRWPSPMMPGTFA
jgi:hypothetical protein